MNLFGVKMNQYFSFSPFCMKISNNSSIFFPGCAILKLDNDIVNGIYNFLKKYDNDCGLCLFCCSAPSYVLNQEYLNKKQMKIAKYFNKYNVKKIYVACPNCKQKLEFIKNKFNLNYEVLFIYDILAENLDKNCKYFPIDEELIIHDPCRMRDEINTMNNIRTILDIVNQKYLEPKFTKEKTICCGNINMLHLTNPKKSEKMRVSRNNQFFNKNIISYCNGCIYAFSKLGTKGVHIVELIFGKSKNNSFLNRIKYILRNRVC